MWFAIAAGAILLIYVLLVLAVYWFAFYTPNALQKEPDKINPDGNRNVFKQMIAEKTEELLTLPYEDVRIRSYDGLSLHARLYVFRESAPLLIGVHGYRSPVMRDFAVAFDYYRVLGFNILLIEHRGHGESEGHTITFGVKERYDIRSWCEYASDRFGRETDIVLGSISMGAASTLMASGLKLPENVRCIVADCPYASPYEIVEHVAKSMKLPGGLSMLFAVPAARIFGRFDLKGADASEAVKRAEIPILFIHGETDGFVPVKMGKRIAEACAPEHALELFPGADHGMSYLTDRARYEKCVYAFLAGHLPEGTLNTRS